jgi:hypothetical protein
MKVGQRGRVNQPVERIERPARADSKTINEEEKDRHESGVQYNQL